MSSGSHTSIDSDAIISHGPSPMPSRRRADGPADSTVLNVGHQLPPTPDTTRSSPAWDGEVYDDMRSGKLQDHNFAHKAVILQIGFLDECVSAIRGTAHLRSIGGTEELTDTLKTLRQGLQGLGSIIGSYRMKWNADVKLDVIPSLWLVRVHEELKHLRFDITAGSSGLSHTVDRDWSPDIAKEHLDSFAGLVERLTAMTPELEANHQHFCTSMNALSKKAPEVLGARYTHAKKVIIQLKNAIYSFLDEIRACYKIGFANSATEISELVRLTAMYEELGKKVETAMTRCAMQWSEDNGRPSKMDITRALDLDLDNSVGGICHELGYLNQDLAQLRRESKGMAKILFPMERRLREIHDHIFGIFD